MPHCRNFKLSRSPGSRSVNTYAAQHYPSSLSLTIPPWCCTCTHPSPEVSWPDRRASSLRAPPMSFHEHARCVNINTSYNNRFFYDPCQHILHPTESKFARKSSADLCSVRPLFAHTAMAAHSYSALWSPQKVSHIDLRAAGRRHPMTQRLADHWKRQR